MSMNRHQRYSVRDVVNLLGVDTKDVSDVDELQTSSDEEVLDNTALGASQVVGNDAESTDDETDEYSETGRGDGGSDDELPGPSARPARNRADRGNRLRWMKKDFIPPDVTFTGELYRGPQNGELETPLAYFRKMVSIDMLENLVANTNEYSIQKNGRCIDTKLKEIEQLLGMFLRMGVTQMPSNMAYWEKDTRYGPVADIMPRNRFTALLGSLHLINNLDTTDEQKAMDKLWKIRPWLVAFRNNCLQIVPEESNSVDEMMIPFKGMFSGIRQYMRGKPHPWGFKLWARTGISGILCDFDVYQGRAAIVGQRSDMGLSGDVVVSLCSTLPVNKNYKVYADNFFSSVPLISKLRESGIEYVGTVRASRLPGCTLKSDKAMKAEGRGSMDSLVEATHNIAAVKWFDNRAVQLVSSFAGMEPVDTVQRWDKRTKSKVTIDRPFVVKTYNKHMGGIDLLDSFCAMYNPRMRTRRWYINIFWHTIILGVINAWLLYRRDCKALNIIPKNILNRRKFQAQLATSIVEINTVPKRRRGSDDVTPQPKRNVRLQPPVDVRKDAIAHWPVRRPEQGRCKNCVKGYATTFCEKCKVFLCFTDKKNCFRDYHT